MGEAPSTRPSLVARLRGPRDEQAWEEFLEIYTPLIHRLARAKGLQGADAADLAQDVFRAVAGAIERWDPDPRLGSFRAWLFRIARNRIIDALAARNRQPRGSGDTSVGRLLEEQPGPSPEDSALFEAEYRRRVFQWAAARVRGEFRDATWHAFWRTSVEGEPPKDVARSLGMTVGAVYVARSRVMARLKRAVEEVEDEGESEREFQPPASEGETGDGDATRLVR